MTSNPLYNELLVQFSRDLKPLADKPEEGPETTLIALWHAAAGNNCSIEAAQGRPLEALSPGQVAGLKELARRRLAGSPLAHLTGRQRFMGIDFVTGPEALVPRKETEILGATVLDLVRKCVGSHGAAIVLDVCTGIGNIPISLAFYEPSATIYAGDISENAIRLASQNAVRLGLEKRITFKTGDLFEPFRIASLQNNIDIVSCNPPYISTSKLQTLPAEIIGHEPQLAFDGGPFGLKILARAVKESLWFLKPGGCLCFEVGLGQGQGMMNLMDKSRNFSSIAAAKDVHDNIRVLIAQR
jgi:release factor glutamine methyltransferase